MTVFLWVKIGCRRRIGRRRLIICLASRCDTPRTSFLFTASLSEWLVRHTPAFGHPSPRGDGLSHHFDYQWSAAAPSPLGEGCTKCGVCRTVNPNIYPSRRGVSHCQTPLIWGVSHHQTSSILDVSHCQISYPLDPVNPWFTYRGSLRSKS